MIITNPTIDDIQVRDYITFKDSATNIRSAYRKGVFHEIRTCEEVDNMSWGNKKYVYEVREVNKRDKSIVVYGWTKTPNPCYDSSVGSWSFQGQKFIQDNLVISINDIDTLYSQKCDDSYLSKVFTNMTTLITVRYDKLSDLLTEKYENVSVGRYNYEFDPCELGSYIRYGKEDTHDISGLDYMIETFQERFFRYGDDNNLVWDAMKINDNFIADDVKETLTSIVSQLTRDVRVLKDQISTNFLELGESDYGYSDTVTKEDREFILDAVTKYYDWIMSFISPLVDTDANKAHNEDIDNLIKAAEHDYHMCETEINLLFSKMDAIKKKIENLKTQYK